MNEVFVRCTHTKGSRVQECLLVLVEDQLACLPIGPAQHGVAKLAGGLALTAVGVVKVNAGVEIDLSQLASAEHLAAAVHGTGGFYVGADWTYRTRIPVIGTMLTHGDETIATRLQVPAEMFAKLTPNRAPLSAKAVKVVVGIGAAILAAAAITYLATGSLELLFGIGFWGILMIAASLYAWRWMRRAR